MYLKIKNILKNNRYYTLKYFLNKKNMTKKIITNQSPYNVMDLKSVLKIKFLSIFSPNYR